MLLTTTSTLQDKKITAYYGLVSGESVIGANIIKDFLAGIRDIVGGRGHQLDWTVMNSTLLERFLGL